MKVIITGGTGLIGSALARSLVSDGHEVVILTRSPQERPDSVPAAARLVGWDARTGEGWSDEVEDADAIVNLAGATLGPEGGLWTRSRKKAILQSRTRATDAVVDALQRASRRPAVLIQGSGIDHYGAHDDEIITEKAPPGTGFLAEVTQVWEATSAPVEALGVRRVVIRTGIVLSAKGGTLTLLALPHKLFVGGPLGSGEQYLAWIHLDDVVAAIRFLIDHEECEGAFNLVAPNPVTNRTFSTILGKVMGRPSLVPVPGFMIKLVLGEMSALALEGRRAVPAALNDAGYEFRFPNLEGALRDLF